MKIEYLCDDMGFVETIAKWTYDEFVDGIRIGLSYEDILRAKKICHKQELPIRLVALVDGVCVGTISIVYNDLECRNYTPWLASLYVDEQFRNQGIAVQLIDSVKGIAVQLGYKELFLRTEHASDYYRRLGWQFVETCEDEFGLKPDVFKLNLCEGML